MSTYVYVAAPGDGRSVEDFETNDFSKFPWSAGRLTAEQDRDDIWTVTSRPSSLVSGDITFYRKVSCESKSDYLKFYINGAEKGRWSGEEDWAQVSFAVTAGRRTFEWTYSKDGSESEGGDTAWIDDIVFPIE